MNIQYFFFETMIILALIRLLSVEKASTTTSRQGEGAIAIYIYKYNYNETIE